MYHLCMQRKPLPLFDSRIKMEVDETFFYAPYTPTLLCDSRIRLDRGFRFHSFIIFLIWYWSFLPPFTSRVLQVFSSMFSKHSLLKVNSNSSWITHFLMSTQWRQWTNIVYSFLIARNPPNQLPRMPGSSIWFWGRKPVFRDRWRWPGTPFLDRLASVCQPFAISYWWTDLFPHRNIYKYINILYDP